MRVSNNSSRLHPNKRHQLRSLSPMNSSCNGANSSSTTARTWSRRTKCSTWRTEWQSPSSSTYSTQSNSTTSHRPFAASRVPLRRSMRPHLSSRGRLRLARGTTADHLDLSSSSRYQVCNNRSTNSLSASQILDSIWATLCKYKIPSNIKDQAPTNKITYWQNNRCEKVSIDEYYLFLTHYF